MHNAIALALIYRLYIKQIADQLICHAREY